MVTGRQPVLRECKQLVRGRGEGADGWLEEVVLVQLFKGHQYTSRCIKNCLQLFSSLLGAGNKCLLLLIASASQVGRWQFEELAQIFY